MASVGESVSTNKRKGDGQRKLQEEAGKSKEKKYSCKYQARLLYTASKINLSYIEAINRMNTLNVILAE